MVMRMKFHLVFVGACRKDHETARIGASPGRFMHRIFFGFDWLFGLDPALRFDESQLTPMLDFEFVRNLVAHCAGRCTNVDEEHGH